MSTEIRIRIHTREPFASGVEFGRTGAYERIIGTVEFTVDPNDSAYAMVVDLDLAPRNERGLVEFSTDLSLLKPVDLSRGNRRLLYDVNNRGNKRVLSFFNDAPGTNDPKAIEDAGNGFLMRRGYTVVWSGWQGDLLAGNSRMTMRVPRAHGVRGPMRAEFIATGPGVTCFPLSSNNYTWSYPAVRTDTSVAGLTARPREAAPRQHVPPNEWQYAAPDVNGVMGPSASHCYLPSGFTPGWIYELVYEAADPHVLGLGFTGMRDLVSYFLNSESDSDGAPNLLRQDGVRMEKAYAYGRSQCGRLLREFVYRGYNEDAAGRQVFSAIHPTVSGGGRVTLNYRFAQPGRYPRQHEDHLYPSDQFPFAYHETTDHHTGRSDGIMQRPDTDPLVVHTQTASEYWERRGSLVHTDSQGNDLPDHEQVRVYLISGAQHHALPGDQPAAGPQKHPSNPLHGNALMRSLLDAMDEWATNGILPPDSAVPLRAEESAVSADGAAARFPVVAGVTPPTEPNRLYVQDHGLDMDSGIQSKEPPEEDRSREYTVLVSQVDADGNEVAGIRLPDVEAPLATYTGWNAWPDEFADGAMFSVIGSCFQLPATAEERKAAGDGRASVEERYRSSGHYVRLVAEAAQRLVDRRLLLQEDADAYVEQAASATAFAQTRE